MTGGGRNAKGSVERVTVSMQLTAIKRYSLGVAATCAFALGSAAHSQTYQMPQPAEPKMSDENNVDLMSGIARFSVTDVAIGDLSHTMSSVHNLDSYTNGFYKNVGFDDNFHGGIGFAHQIDNGGAWDYRSSYLAGMGGGEKFFINTDGSLEATGGGRINGVSAGTIAACGQTGTTAAAGYTSKDGAEMLFDLTKTRSMGGSNNVVKPGGCGVATKITSTDGLITRINYKQIIPIPGYTWSRIQSVTRNDGLQLKYTYGPDQYNPSGQLIAYGPLLSVTGINNAYQACDPMADTCTLTGAWPQATYSWSGSADSVLSVTDQANRITRFTMDPSGRVVGVKPPTSTVDKFTYKYCSRGTYFTGVWVTDTTGEVCQSISGPFGNWTIVTVHDRVVQATQEGRAWNYTFPLGTIGSYGPYYVKYEATGTEGRGAIGISTILGTGALLVFGSDKLVASFENTARNRMTSAAVLGKPQETYTYDARGNVTSDGLRSAGYDATCANMKTCNKPNWVKDVAGNQTDFTYDPTHGGVLTETGPSDINGIRPQKRFAYVQRFAWFLNPAGVMTRSTEGIWKRATESFCKTTAASGAGCAGGTTDQVVTTFDYGPDSGPNNLFLRGKLVADGGVSLRTCYRYDKYGNKISETQPLANLTSCP